jgi:SSS family solute:Na+ symporter
VAIIISLADKSAVMADVTHSADSLETRPTKKVWLSWILLAIVMIALYIFFNGH